MNPKQYLNLPNINECREKTYGDKKTITKRLEDNCPWCHSPVVLKQVVYKGKKPRSPFKACSNYPACDWTDYKEPI